MIKNNDKNCYFYGLGHCMVDFFVPNVDDLIFSKLKANSPLHLDKEEFSDFFSNFDIKIKKTGGTTVNILKTISRLGGKCFFSGSTGMEREYRDENALFFQKEMARQGVECQLFSRPDSTGRFLSIYNKNGEKAIAVNVGAAKQIEATQINEIRFAHSSCFVMEGMQFLNQEVLERVVDLAFRYNVPLAIDCGTFFGAEAVAKRLWDISQSLDILLFANEGEVAALKQYVEKPQDCCLVYVEKFGAKGSKVYFDGEEFFQPAFEIENVKKFKNHAGNQIYIEDTGAGDTFVGSFLHSIFSSIDNSILELTFETVKSSIEKAAKEATLVLDDFGV